jgi:tetratricopeptide (TPR) repeat protein
MNEPEAGYSRLQTAVDLRTALWQAHPASREIRRELGSGYLYLSDGYSNFFKPGKNNITETEIHQKSLALFRQAVEVREALFQEDLTDIQSKRDVAQARQRIGYKLMAIGRENGNDEKILRESLENMLVALRLRDEVAGDIKAAVMDSRRLADQYLMVGITHLELKKYDIALENFRRSQDIFQTLIISDPNNAEIRRDLGYSMLYTGNALVSQNKPNEARPPLLAAQRIIQELYVKDNNKEDLDVLQRIQQELDKL